MLTMIYTSRRASHLTCNGGLTNSQVVSRLNHTKEQILSRRIFTPFILNRWQLLKFLLASLQPSGSAFFGLDISILSSEGIRKTVR